MRSQSPGGAVQRRWRERGGYACRVSRIRRDGKSWFYLLGWIFFCGTIYPPSPPKRLQSHRQLVAVVGEEWGWERVLQRVPGALRSWQLGTSGQGGSPTSCLFSGPNATQPMVALSDPDQVGVGREAWFWSSDYVLGYPRHQQQENIGEGNFWANGEDLECWLTHCMKLVVRKTASVCILWNNHKPLFPWALLPTTSSKRTSEVPDSPVSPHAHKSLCQGWGCSLVTEFWDMGEKKE